MSGPVGGSAVMSACGAYRYLLRRHWGSGPTIGFVMLNPSTADADVDDPTIRRCLALARAWGAGTLEVGNLFALRATDPRKLREASDPVGPENDTALVDLARRAHTLVAAWGTHGVLHSRDSWVRSLLVDFDLRHLGLTKNGAPKHPLYLRADTKSAPWVHR